MTTDRSPFKDRYEAVLSAVFGGLHNAPKPKEYGNGIRVLVHGCMATFDFDNLTLLVLAAHKYCVRAEISCVNMQFFRLAIHPRQREGRMHERHPSIGEVMETVFDRL